MASTEHPTPGPKIPEHLSTAKPARSREEKIDRQMEDTFPASDPPSYSGGNHVIGAPKERESEPVKGGDPEVVTAEEKVKDGSAKESHKY
jgi:hypothetical protein